MSINFLNFKKMFYSLFFALFLSFTNPTHHHSTKGCDTNVSTTNDDGGTGGDTGGETGNNPPPKDEN